MKDQPFSGLSTIGQVYVPVMDLDRAVSFYRERLGLSFSFQTESMAFFDCEGVRLMLGLPEEEGIRRTSSIIYFNVEDINIAYHEMRERAVRFIEKPHLVAKMPDYDLWMAFFQDSEGNLMALMAEQEKDLDEDSSNPEK